MFLWNTGVYCHISQATDSTENFTKCNCIKYGSNLLKGTDFRVVLENNYSMYIWISEIVFSNFHFEDWTHDIYKYFDVYLMYCISVSSDVNIIEQTLTSKMHIFTELHTILLNNKHCFI